MSLPLYGDTVDPDDGPGLDYVECVMCGWRSPAYETALGRHATEIADLLIVGHSAKVHHKLYDIRHPAAEAR